MKKCKVFREVLTNMVFSVKLVYILLFAHQYIDLSSMAATDSTVITKVTNPIQHGEGPHWDNKTQALYFVNTFDPMVLRLKDGEVTYQRINCSNSIGTVTPIANAENRFLITADRTVYIMDWNGDANNTGNVNYSNPIIENLEPGLDQNQCNDGKADSKGRFWIGTLWRDPDLSVTKTGGSLYLICNNRTVRTRMRDVTISNGLAWNLDNSKFYYIDSTSRKIQVFDYDSDAGDISNGQVLFDLANYPHIGEDVIPDGMTIDTDDNLWVALHGGGAVLRINGTDGTLLRTIEMPVTYITSAAFGGRDLDILYVTTSKLNLNESMLEMQPDAGSVYAVTGLGVRGTIMNDYIPSSSSSFSSTSLLFILYFPHLSLLHLLR